MHLLNFDFNQIGNREGVNLLMFYFCCYTKKTVYSLVHSKIFFLNKKTD